MPFNKDCLEKLVDFIRLHIKKEIQMVYFIDLVLTIAGNLKE